MFKINFKFALFQHKVCCSYAVAPSAIYVKGFDCVHIPGVSEGGGNNNIQIWNFCRLCFFTSKAQTAGSAPVPVQSNLCGNSNGLPNQTTCCKKPNF